MSRIEDLLVEALEVLEAVEVELEQLAEAECPTPDATYRHLEERMVLLEVMRRAPEEWKEKLRELFVEERDRHPTPPEANYKVPVDEDVQRLVAGFNEVLRRAQVADDDVRAIVLRCR